MWPLKMRRLWLPVWKQVSRRLRKKGKIDDRYIKVVGMAGDGGTMDIGMQALSGAMERGHDMLFVCFDNEAYMNTGIQRSSGTPMGASTTTAPAGKISFGQKTWKKNMPEIMVAHGVPYVATACPSYPLDFIRKVEKAKSIKGPSYIHCFSVCPPAGVVVLIWPLPWGVWPWNRVFSRCMKWKMANIRFLRKCRKN